MKNTVKIKPFFNTVKVIIFLVGEDCTSVLIFLWTIMFLRELFINFSGGMTWPFAIFVFSHHSH